MGWQGAGTALGGAFVPGRGRDASGFVPGRSSAWEPQLAAGVSAREFLGRAPGWGLLIRKGIEGAALLF